MNWELFEKESTSYLNSTFGNDRISFQLQGSHDSTVADIKTYIDGNFKFSIEVKKKSAQSGQFVLLDNGNQFIYSPKNKSDINEFSRLILEYMNKNYSTYRDVSTNALEIALPQKIFESWIKNHYLNKEVKYIITNNDSNYIIFPLDKYGEYFNIKANFRIKGSGSSNMPKSDQEVFSNLIKDKYCDNEITFDGKKAYCIIDTDIPDKSKIFCNKNNRRYQLNKISPKKYEIRKLSNTRNANVIFSIELIANQFVDDLNKFKSEFK
ncbi:hypothetical protein [Romboutsia sp. MSSM.1001216sp_RTP31141st1_G3_RTP31141_220114]|uniref:hypothetical protein n=1 Tax=unclassified Romboutsia TaxID=2626894 RepID=UPI0031B5C944